MSAISTSNGTGTLTGPIPAAHRTDAPVWAFHHLLELTIWVIASVLYRASVWEHAAATRHPRAVIGYGLGLIGAAILALVVFA